MAQYVELHAQSAFSFLEASSSPAQLAVACANTGMAAMAVIDAHGVYGSARFH
jgi:error-prone DNA polymerase